jgi:hypothetical protein
VFQVEDIVGEVDEIKENFELSDSVAVLKDYLSKKCSCGPEMISISYNGQLYWCCSLPTDVQNLQMKLFQMSRPLKTLV